MSIAERATQTTWKGPLASGEGTLSDGQQRGAGWPAVDLGFTD